MDNVLIITDRNVRLIDLQEWYQDILSFEYESDHVIHYSTPKKFLSIIDDINMNEFDEAEMYEIKKLIENPRAFLVDTNDLSLLKKFVNEFPEHKSLIIDNDHGRFLSRNELMKCTSSSELFS